VLPGEAGGPEDRAASMQAKLAINQPGDPYEQEADRLADLVMRMPDPAWRGSRHGGGAGTARAAESPAAPSVRDSSVQRQVPGATAPASPPAGGAARQGLAPPPAALARERREPDFSHDFGRVRTSSAAPPNDPGCPWDPMGRADQALPTAGRPGGGRPFLGIRAVTGPWLMRQQRPAQATPPRQAAVARPPDPAQEAAPPRRCLSMSLTPPASRLTGS